jgi:hypothetical protein
MPSISHEKVGLGNTLSTIGTLMHLIGIGLLFFAGLNGSEDILGKKRA